MTILSKQSALFQLRVHSHATLKFVYGNESKIFKIRIPIFKHFEQIFRRQNQWIHRNTGNTDHLLSFRLPMCLAQRSTYRYYRYLIFLYARGLNCA